MSKQHLADMLKHLTSGDTEAAKASFSQYATEKSQEILARDDAQVEEPVAPVEPTEPVVPTEPVEEPAVTEPTDDDTKE